MFAKINFLIKSRWWLNVIYFEVKFIFGPSIVWSPSTSTDNNLFRTGSSKTHLGIKKLSFIIHSSVTQSSQKYAFRYSAAITCNAGTLFIIWSYVSVSEPFTAERCSIGRKPTSQKGKKCNSQLIPRANVSNMALVNASTIVWSRKHFFPHALCCQMTAGWPQATLRQFQHKTNTEPKHVLISHFFFSAFGESNYRLRGRSDRSAGSMRKPLRKFPLLHLDSLDVR